MDDRRLKWFIAENTAVLARQGSVQQTWRGRLGPYYRIVCRTDGGQRTFYLGNDMNTVQAARRLLAELQSQRRRELKLNRIERALRRQLRLAKRQLDTELRAVGLYLKGFEVRGWRSAAQSRQGAGPPKMGKGPCNGME